jgi:hypothetical protein
VSESLISHYVAQKHSRSEPKTDMPLLLREMRGKLWQWLQQGTFPSFFKNSFQLIFLQTERSYLYQRFHIKDLQIIPIKVVLISPFYFGANCFHFSSALTGCSIGLFFSDLCKVKVNWSLPALWRHVVTRRHVVARSAAPLTLNFRTRSDWQASCTGRLVPR